MSATDRAATRRFMLNLVPEVTAYFWIIKILCTAVGTERHDIDHDSVDVDERGDLALES